MSYNFNIFFALAVQCRHSACILLLKTVDFDVLSHRNQWLYIGQREQASSSPDMMSYTMYNNYFFKVLQLVHLSMPSYHIGEPSLISKLLLPCV